MNMTGKRLKPETHVQIKTLSEEGYNTRQIAARLQLAHMIVARSINNFKATVKYGYEKPTGCQKCTTKCLHDAIIFSAKKSPRKTVKDFQVALPEDVVFSGQRTVRRRLFRANLKSYRPAKKLKLSQENNAARLAFCQKY